MEPIWLHAKRNVAEPNRELSVNVLTDRLCSIFNATLDDASLKPSDWRLPKAGTDRDGRMTGRWAK